ncbi:MAG: hypothetical protein ACYS6K_29450 [Planctomycetota bacterium]
MKSSKSNDESSVATFALRHPVTTYGRTYIESGDLTMAIRRRKPQRKGQRMFNPIASVIISRNYIYKSV